MLEFADGDDKTSWKFSSCSINMSSIITVLHSALVSSAICKISISKLNLQDLANLATSNAYTHDILNCLSQAPDWNLTTELSLAGFCLKSTLEVAVLPTEEHITVVSFVTSPVRKMKAVWIPMSSGTMYSVFSNSIIGAVQQNKIYYSCLNYISNVWEVNINFIFLNSRWVLSQIIPDKSFFFHMHGL